MHLFDQRFYNSLVLNTVQSTTSINAINNGTGLVLLIFAENVKVYLRGIYIYINKYYHHVRMHVCMHVFIYRCMCIIVSLSKGTS